MATFLRRLSWRRRPSGILDNQCASLWSGWENVPLRSVINSTRNAIEFGHARRWYAKGGKAGAGKAAGGGAARAAAAKAAKAKGKPSGKPGKGKGKQETSTSAAQKASWAAEGGNERGVIDTTSFFKDPVEFEEDEVFTGAANVLDLKPKDVNKYFFLSEENAHKYFPEGFPSGLLKEFQFVKSSFIQVRSNILQLCNRLQYAANGTLPYSSSHLFPGKRSSALSFKNKFRQLPDETTETESTSEESSEQPSQSQKLSKDEEVKTNPNATDESNATDDATSLTTAAMEALIEPPPVLKSPPVDEEGIAASDLMGEDGIVLETKYEEESVESVIAKVPEKILEGMKKRRCFLLDGNRGCGKSITLAMIVQWARAQGWLVFYVPNGKHWSHGGYYYLNQYTGLWDTPLQAQEVLKGFLESHGEMLSNYPCRVMESIFLSESAGLGRQPGPQEFTMAEGSTLKDLVEKGATQQTAASNIVVRLRQELNLITEVPVLIAIDEYNSWFTFSEYYEFIDFRKKRQVHAKELAMVSAFRPMAGGERCFFVGAFSHSTAVGKIPLDLPGAPYKYRFFLDPFDRAEATAALQYYHRQNLVLKDPGEDRIAKLFYLTNGNGAELRTLSRIM